MAVSFGTTKQMQLIRNADSTTGFSGAFDGLDGLGYNIQGTDSVYIAIRKSETLPITITPVSAITIPSRAQVIAWAASSVAQTAVSQTFQITGNGGSTTAVDVKVPMNGYFQAFAFDCPIATTGTSFTNVVWNWVADGTNIRAAPNIWMDALYCGDGIDIAGTTTTDSLFTEAQAFDESSDAFNAVLLEENGILFAQADIYISTTTGNSTRETVVFYETFAGSNDYILSGNGTINWQGTQILKSGAVVLDLDFTGMTVTINGGTFNYDTLTLVSGQSVSNCTFADSGTATVGCNLSGVIFDSSGLVTLSGSPTLTSCSFTTSTAASALSLGSGTLNNCTFTGDGTTTPGHAVDLGTVSTTGAEVAWNSTLINTGNQSIWEGSTQVATAGTQGTANSAITVNVTSGNDLTINVATGSTVPTVQNTGTGTVAIVAGQVTLTLNNIVADSSANIAGGAESSEVRIYSAGTSTALAGIEDVVETVASSKKGTFSYTYTFAASTFVDIRVFHKNYQPVVLLNYELEAGNVSLPINQIFDRNFIP